MNKLGFWIFIFIGISLFNISFTYRFKTLQAKLDELVVQCLTEADERLTRIEKRLEK